MEAIVVVEMQDLVVRDPRLAGCRDIEDYYTESPC